MKAEVTKTGSYECEIAIELPPERFREKIEEQFRNLKKDLNLPGFRQGKVPMSIIRSRFEKD
ncbi:MAG TPA: trigger factor family protein [bacterium]|nr:trigger factor family protein [bacterium]